MCSNLSYKYFFDVLQFCEAEFLGFGGCLFYIAFVELLCTDVIVDYLWERFIWTFHEKLPLPLGRPVLFLAVLSTFCRKIFVFWPPFVILVKCLL